MEFSHCIMWDVKHFWWHHSCLSLLYGARLGEWGCPEKKGIRILPKSVRWQLDWLAMIASQPWGNAVWTSLSQWPLDKVAAISQTTFSNAFSWMKNFVFWFEFEWSLFLRFQLTIFQYLLRWWLGADQATSHYLNQHWPDSLMHICITWGRWVITHWPLQDVAVILNV